VKTHLQLNNNNYYYYYNYVVLMSLLHVSATNWPTSGKTYYLGNHCTVNFVLIALRHMAAVAVAVVVVVVVVVVNLLRRTFLSYLF
jgi:hypothetical protein